MPYFAYFSNLSPQTLGPDAVNQSRRFPILRTRPGLLRAYELAFDVPGIPPLEPVFCNIRATTKAGRPTSGDADAGDDEGVHGVVHWLSAADFRRLARSEMVFMNNTENDSSNNQTSGGGGETGGNGLFSNFRPPFPMPPPLLPGVPLPSVARMITVAVHTIDPCSGRNEIVHARTFEFPHIVPAWAPVSPSNRYLSLGLSGASHWGLDRTAMERAIRTWAGVIPHPLDRPNPAEQFGSPALEIFSPYTQIRAREGMKRLDEAMRVTRDLAETELRLVQLSTGPQGSRQGLYFLPGIDGQGKSVLGQVADIDAEGEYCVKAVVYPQGNRDTLEQMASAILQLIASDTAAAADAETGARSQPTRVSLLAESMGGVLAVVTVLENVRRKQQQAQSSSSSSMSSNMPTIDIDLLLMVNPATSYRRSGPRELWDFLFGLGLSEDVYRALLPPVLLPFLVDLGSTTTGINPELLPRLVNVLRSVGSLSDALPKDTMQHRINLLARHHVSEARLKLLTEAPHAPRFVALVSTVNDRLLPSYSESNRLRRAVPGIYRVVIPFGGHGPFLDRRLSLVSFLRPFLPSRVRDGSAALPSSMLVRPAKPSETDAATASDDESSPNRKNVIRRRVALRKRYKARIAKMKGNTSEGESYLSARMKQSPENTITLGRTMSRKKMNDFYEYARPAFERFDPVFIGEENIPAYDAARPILFVGNHTLLGWLDGMFPVIRLLMKRRILMRTFGHPILFRSERLGFPMMGVDAISTDQLVQYGLTPVLPSYVLSALSRGEWGMMFPGGANEALKSRKDKKYAVKWPEEPEFIRACALFGASVIPVSIIGTEDNSRIVADPEETRAVAEAIGKVVTRNRDFSMLDLVQDFDVRMWKRGPDGKSDTPLVPPLVVPSSKSGRREERIYIRFGKPIDISPDCVDDKALSNTYYKQVRSVVEEGIELLLQRKQKDVYNARWRREEFKREFGNNSSPPCAPGWSWMRGDDSYLDDDLQPPL